MFEFWPELPDLFHVGIVGQNLVARQQELNNTVGGYHEYLCVAVVLHIIMWLTFFIN